MSGNATAGLNDASSRPHGAQTPAGSALRVAVPTRMTARRFHDLHRRIGDAFTSRKGQRHDV